VVIRTLVNGIFCCPEILVPVATVCKNSLMVFHYVERLKESVPAPGAVFMSAVNEIRVLHRGLQMLETANLHNGACLRDFVRLTGLPKTTVHRILENLRSAGYLRRDPEDERYYVTLQVRRLSDGFYDGGWVSDIARPVLEEFANKVRFPVAIATPYGAAMMLRDNTDAHSNLAPNVYARGTVLPLLTSASGKVFLAFCDEVTRKTLLDVCARSMAPEDEMARHPRLVNQALARVRKNGYAFGHGARKTEVKIPTTTFSVPIRSRGHLVGCLVMRYLRESMSRPTVVKRYLDIINRHARKIGSRITEKE
jgi:IclR family mhp operon transcriptional activator